MTAQEKSDLSLDSKKKRIKLMMETKMAVGCCLNNNASFSSPLNLLRNIQHSNPSYKKYANSGLSKKLLIKKMAVVTQRFKGKSLLSASIDKEKWKKNSIQIEFDRLVFIRRQRKFESFLSGKSLTNNHVCTFRRIPRLLNRLKNDSIPDEESQKHSYSVDIW